MGSNSVYDLNDPRNLSVAYTQEEISAMSEEEQLKALNELWRNYCISDSYEPGSTFKPITVAACLRQAGKARMSAMVDSRWQTVILNVWQTVTVVMVRFLWDRLSWFPVMM